MFLLSIYLFLWIFNYTHIQALQNLINNQVLVLQKINISVNIASETRPKVLIRDLQQDAEILVNINNLLEVSIDKSKSDLSIVYNSLKSDIVELNQKANELEVSTIEISEEDFSSLELPEVYNKVANLKLDIKSLEQNLKESINTKRNQGVFINPLKAYTKSALKDIIANMSPEEKAGQLLMFSIDGSRIDSNNAKSIIDQKLGGIILMGYNISTQQQLKNFTTQIQLNNDSIPLFIATDQEGGVVKRVSWDNTAGAKSWAALSDTELCELSKNRSVTLQNGGINLNFAPVVDLTYNGIGFINNRTISSDADIVTQKATEFITCSQTEGVATTLKHFPGHGATAADSHFDLPVIDKSKEDWLNSDALPFKNLTDSDFVMVGHLVMQSIDADTPATLSKPLLADILRDEFGYQGIVITDDMHQLQVSTGMNYKLAIKEALLAGVDILLYVGFPASRENIHTEVTRLITSGEISMDMIDEKLYRILQQKYYIE